MAAAKAVRLPAEFRFKGTEVLIRRDPVTGNVILSSHNKKFEDWIKLRDELLPHIPPEDFDALDDLRDKRSDVDRNWP